MYDFNLWLVQISLGIRLTGEMNLNFPKTNCDSNGREQQNQVVDFTPEVRVKAAGEAQGKALIIRGGVDVVGDFNYFANLLFEPKPELCLSAYNGYKPMNVSIESWYQVINHF